MLFRQRDGRFTLRSISPNEGNATVLVSKMWFSRSALYFSLVLLTVSFFSPQILAGPSQKTCGVLAGNFDIGQAGVAPARNRQCESPNGISRIDQNYA